MDEALEYLADRGPIYRGYLVNHGPMAAEALLQMARPDAVLQFLEWYKPGLEGRPSLQGRVDGANWHEMLGRPAGFEAWLRFFEAELARQPWRAVLETWAGRLAPGLWGALLHGVIRTGHAARSLAAKETPLRRRELAEGLALWASSYEALPDAPGEGTLSPGAAFGSLPLLPPEQRGARPPMDDPSSLPGFEGVAGLVDVTDPAAALSELTETYAGFYLANAGLPGNSPIILIHGVTGPSALRLLAPHVSVGTQRLLLRYAWQAAAKITASWNFGAETAPVEGVELDREDVIEQAVASRDEHAMKLVEACLREYEVNPTPVYLAAARDVAARLSG